MKKTAPQLAILIAVALFALITSEPASAGYYDTAVEVNIGSESSGQECLSIQTFSPPGVGNDMAYYLDSSGVAHSFTGDPTGVASGLFLKPGTYFCDVAVVSVAYCDGEPPVPNNFDFFEGVQ